MGDAFAEWVLQRIDDLTGGIGLKPLEAERRGCYVTAQPLESVALMRPAGDGAVQLI
jgi:hypothetical protein